MSEIATAALRFGGENLLLTNQRAIFAPDYNALIVCDLHIGKSAHFRRHGSPITAGVFLKDLQRLESLIRHFSAENIFINGDLIHAGNNSEVEFFGKWQQSLGSKNWILVKGNHDRLDEKIQNALILNQIEDLVYLGGVALSHDSLPDLAVPQINGHIHPGIVYRDRIRKLRMPCYAVTTRQLLMPAFSEFTGLDVQNTPKKATYFLFSAKAVYEV